MEIKISDGALYYGDKILRPLQTSIVQAEKVGQLIIVREDYFKYKGSSIYATDLNLKVIWEAEIPDFNDDTYSGSFVVKNNTIVCYSWNGIECELSIEDGKIRASRLTK